MNSDDKPQGTAEITSAAEKKADEKTDAPENTDKVTSANAAEAKIEAKPAEVPESGDSGKQGNYVAKPEAESESPKDTQKAADGAQTSENGDDGANLQVAEEGAQTGEENNDSEYEPDSDDEEEPRKSHRVLKAIIYSFCVVTVSVVLAIGFLFCYTDYLGMFREDKTAKVKISNSDDIQQVASTLKSNGIIRSSAGFRAYIKFSKKSGLKNGIYELNSTMSYAQIVQSLRNLDNRATVKVTIPEGYTLEKIGALLEEKDVCSAKDFLKAANSSSIEFDFQSEIPNNKNRFYRLEGYVFPDTYEFFLEQSADSVVKKMLDNFDKRFNDDLRKKATGTGMSIDQIVILASIIQTESGNTSEMGKVSSVFHNRLKYGVNSSKKLQSDATVLYGTRVIKPVKNDAKIISAYNTYDTEGLPPGAICNPGLDAIEAAISPEDTSYFYFVSDSNGNYYYAKTFSKHLSNIKKANKSGKASGTNSAG